MTQSHLESLWLKTNEKMNVGNAKHRKLNPTKAASYGATEIYSCTVVVILDGSGVSIGHFPQEAGPVITMQNEAATDKRIITPKIENLSMVDYSTQSVAYIVHSATTTSSVGYRRIEDFLVGSDVSEENIHSIPYTAGRSTVSHRGKVVVTWEPKQEGGATMKLYLQNDEPIYVRDFDANGNPCMLIG